MKRLFFLILLFSASVSYAATPQSMVGGSGLGMMRTAEILGPGESSWFINGTASDYESLLTPGESAFEIEGTMGYAHSLGGHTEFSLLVPYALYSSFIGAGASYAGSRGITGILKHSFTDPVYEQGSAFAFTLLYSLYPGQAGTNISSGETLHEFEFNYSHWAQTTGFHLNVGYGKLDHWSESTIPPFVALEVIKASTGIEVGLSDSMTFSLQALAEQAIATADENLLGSAVVSYAVSKHTIFTFGGTWAIPANRSRPNSSLLFGLSYSPQAKRKTRYKIRGSSEQLHDQNEEILHRVDDIDQRIGRLEDSMAPPASSMQATDAEGPMATEMGQGMSDTNTTTAVPLPEQSGASTMATNRVEIMLIGMPPERAQAVVDSLRKAGYDVVVHSQSTGTRQKRTHIYYREGLSEEAVKLGHNLKGNQIVVRRRLPEGIDIRVELGSDLIH